jgi:4-hydroxy-tetrahydrodipicolinate synthase
MNTANTESLANALQATPPAAAGMTFDATPASQAEGSGNAFVASRAPGATLAARHPSAAALFRGTWVALATPFLDGFVDLPALRRLVRFYRDAGVHGIVACGTTAEAASMDHAEQLAVLDTVLEEAGSLPVVMGLAGSNQRQAVARAAELSLRPISGLLSPAPAYVRPSQAGVRHWFTALADTSRCPLALYDIPYRTGVQIELATLLDLAGHPNIVAVKDCGGSIDKTTALIQDGRLAVMAGEDMQALNTLCLGGAGVILASAHVRPDLHVAMYEAVAAGRLEQAQAIFHALAPVIRLLYEQPNPGPLKAALRAMHGCSAEVRAPMTGADDALAARLAQAIRALPPAAHPDDRHSAVAGIDSIPRPYALAAS